MACLRAKSRRGTAPQKPPTASLYKTWEVKVSLLDKTGTPKSLKRGRTEAIVKQLRIHREFGSPDTSLLELYVCEAGFMRQNQFPPSEAFDVIQERVAALRKGLFGYQLLPFEHAKDGDQDVGLLAPYNVFKPLENAIPLLRPNRTPPTGPFLELAKHLDNFAKSQSALSKKRLGFVVIVHCKRCKNLGLISMKDDFVCPRCASYLAAQ